MTIRNLDPSNLSEADRAELNYEERALVENIEDDRNSYGHLFEKDKQVSANEIPPFERVAEILAERDDLTESLKDRILNSVNGLELDTLGSLGVFYEKLQNESVDYIEEAVSLACDSELPLYVIVMYYDHKVAEAIV